MQGKGRKGKVVLSERDQDARNLEFGTKTSRGFQLLCSTLNRDETRARCKLQDTAVGNLLVGRSRVAQAGWAISREKKKGRKRKLKLSSEVEADVDVASRASRDGAWSCSE